LCHGTAIGTLHYQTARIAAAQNNAHVDAKFSGNPNGGVAESTLYTTLTGLALIELPR